MPLSVRYHARLVPGERERRSRYPQLAGNGKDRCEQTEAPDGAASQWASTLHVGLR